MGAPDFWNSNERAQKHIAKLNGLKKTILPVVAYQKKLDDIAVMLELIEGEDAAAQEAYDKELTGTLAALTTELDELEIASFLTGQFDRNNAIFSIQAGAGGTESNDWADIMFRMYSRWAERRNFEVELMDVQPGDTAGISKATILIKGENAYGYAKAERGVHRLVRISPFDSNKRRHTSFCAVDVVAEITDEINIDIAENDLRIDVYRSSGKGGQGVNTTDSAVRLTHAPTGIVVVCQNERSQIKNKATAMKQLKNKLYQRESDKLAAAKALLDADKQDVSFGSQIRSYVFQPYTMVNDHRTELKIADVQKVMDGGIDPFIQAYLKQESEEKAEGRPL